MASRLPSPLVATLRRAAWLPVLTAAALAANVALRAADPTPDDQARFLAGLPVEGTALDSLGRERFWNQHATEFGKAWSELDQKQLAPIRSWLPSYLPSEVTDTAPLYYMFSGPDFLYAHTFFPHASTYVFCGIEPVGDIPDVTRLPADALNSALVNLRNSLDSVLNFSFFITADMKVDLKATQLTGTLPVLYVFLARQGCQIDRVELVSLNDEGDFVTDKPRTPGVCITFHQGSDPAQKLYYFSTDLSNSGIKARPGLVRFCQKLGRGNALLKAASYLMHLSEFTSVKDFLLAQCKAIVQDDSGIPWRFYDPYRWEMATFGRYVGPIDLFKQHYQNDLAAAAKAMPGAPQLPFSFGYRWRPTESLLIAAKAMDTVPKAIPLTQAELEKETTKPAIPASLPPASAATPPKLEPEVIPRAIPVTEEELKANP